MATRKQNDLKKCQLLVDRYKHALDLRKASDDAVTSKWVHDVLMKKFHIPIQDLFRIVAYMEHAPHDDRVSLSQLVEAPYRFVCTPPFAIRYEVAKGVHAAKGGEIDVECHSAWLYDHLMCRERALYALKARCRTAFVREFGSEDEFEACLCPASAKGSSAYVTHPAIAEEELSVGEMLMDLACEDSADASLSRPDVVDAVSAHARSRGIRLTPRQRAAVLHAIDRRVTVVCGNPGTGKSTIVESVLNQKVDAERRRVVVMAPTGMAVNNLVANTTARETVTYATIHKMTYGGFYKMAQSGESVQDMVIDEFSMVDFQLFVDLMRWCRRFECTLLILADENQLPPIGAGKVLRTILRTKRLPVFRLGRIMRQDAGALRDAIGTMSRHELVGYDAFDQDSLCVEATDDFDEATVRDIVARHGLSPTNSRFITPQHKHAEGTVAMNRVLQRVYHPGKRDAATPSFKTDYYVYVGDTVVRNTNDYRADTMVANGDVGRVCRGKRLGFYNVEYERKGNTEEVFVDDLYTDFSLAYCTTVHKAQGSQFPYVVVLMGANHEFSWKENSDACALLYTAASRARRRCVIVGDPRLFRRAQKHRTDAAPDDVGRFMVDFVSEWD